MANRPKKRTLGARILVSDHNRLLALAEEQRTTPSDLTRKMISDGIERAERKSQRKRRERNANA